MERESKKRGREEAKRGKAEAESSKKGKTTADFAGTDPEEEIVGSQSQPLGVFEFPWRDEGVVLTSEGWDLRDVFFSSLVDCRAAPATIDIRDGEGSSAPPPPSDGEADGADCIWGCALSQPLRA